MDEGVYSCDQGVRIGWTRVCIHVTMLSGGVGEQLCTGFRECCVCWGHANDGCFETVHLTACRQSPTL